MNGYRSMVSRQKNDVFKFKSKKKKKGWYRMKILSKKKYNKLIEDFEESQKKGRGTQKDKREYREKAGR